MSANETALYPSHNVYIVLELAQVQINVASLKVLIGRPTRKY